MPLLPPPLVKKLAAQPGQNHVMPGMERLLPQFPCFGLEVDELRWDEVILREGYYRRQKNILMRS